GEGGEEIDLPLAEWLDDRAGEKHYADRAALAQQGHADCGAEAAEPLRIKMDEFRIGEDIGDMHDALFEYGAADHRPAIDPHRERQQMLQIFGLEAVGRDMFDMVATHAVDHRPLGAAQP